MFAFHGWIRKKSMYVFLVYLNIAVFSIHKSLVLVLNLCIKGFSRC